MRMLRAILFGLAGLLLGGPVVAVLGLILLPLLAGVLDVITHEPSPVELRDWGQPDSSPARLLLPQQT